MAFYQNVQVRLNRDNLYLNNSSMHVRRAAAPRSKIVEDVVEFLENEKLCKPSTSSTELQQRLLLNGSPRHSQLLRERVLDLHHTGMNQQIIAGKVKSSRHFVQNVLRDNLYLNNSSMHVRRAAAPRSKI